MADEARVDLHHGASRCLLGLIDAAAGGLADWSGFDAEAERWGIEVRGLYPRDPYAKGDLPEPLPRLHGTAGTSICEDGKTGEVGFVGRSEGRKCSSRVTAGARRGATRLLPSRYPFARTRKCSSRLSRSGAESGSTGRKRETRSIQILPMQRSQDLGYVVGRARRRGLAVFASGYAIVATGLLQHLRAAVVYLDGHLLAAPIGGFPKALEHSHMQSAVRARQPVQLCDNGVCVYVIGQLTLPLCSSLSIGPISYATTAFVRPPAGLGYRTGA
jgi:hypothetical protein